MTNNSNRELQDYLALFNRRKGILILAVVLVTGATVVASVLQTPVYQGKARLFLEANASVFDPIGAQQLSPARIQTEIQRIQSAPVRAAVQEKVGVAPPVSVVQVGQTQVLQVSVMSATPQRAAQLTDAYVNAYLDYRRQQAVESLVAQGKGIQRAIDDLRAQVAELDAKAATTTTRPPVAGVSAPAVSTVERDALISQMSLFKQKLDQLGVDSTVTSTTAQPVAPAEVPTRPTSPRPVRNALLGLFVGFILGIGAALVVDHLDDSIKTKDDMETVTKGLPVLGIIPTVASWKNRNESRLISRTEPSSPPAEAYRSLRTSIKFLGVDQSMRVIQVTSSNASEGKTTTIANLAVALARAGERVLVVNCDLRRPRVHDFFGLADSQGFTNVFLGEMPITALLQEVPGEPNLRILTSGRLPPNPSEVLSSPRTAQIFAALKSQDVFVLIDCPPVLPVTDAAVLSSGVDGTVLVASAGSTTRKELTRALELLRQVSAPLVGTVLNGVSAEGGYGYQYGYYTPDSPQPQESNRKRRTAAKTAKGGVKSGKKSRKQSHATDDMHHRWLAEDVPPSTRRSVASTESRPLGRLRR